MTKLSGSLPKGIHNGLTTIDGDLITAPHKPRIAIVALDCMRVTTDTDTGEAIPTARILRVEVVAHADLSTAHQLMRTAYEARSGEAALPFGDDEKHPLDILFDAARDTTGNSLLTFDEDGTISRLNLNTWADGQGSDADSEDDA